MTNVIQLNTHTRRWNATGRCVNMHDITNPDNVILVKRTSGTTSRLCRECANDRAQNNRPQTNRKRAVQPSVGSHPLDHQQLSAIAHKLTNARPNLSEAERDVVADVLRRMAHALRRTETISRHPVWRHRRQEGMVDTLRRLLGIAPSPGETS